MEEWNQIKDKLGTIDTLATQVKIHLEGTDHEESAIELLKNITEFMNEVYDEEGDLPNA